MRKSFLILLSSLLLASCAATTQSKAPLFFGLDLTNSTIYPICENADPTGLAATNPTPCWLQAKGDSHPLFILPAAKELPPGVENIFATPRNRDDEESEPESHLGLIFIFDKKMLSHQCTPSLGIIFPHYQSQMPSSSNGTLCTISRNGILLSLKMAIKAQVLSLSAQKSNVTYSNNT